MKLSKFNMVSELDGYVYVYNGMSGGLMQIDQKAYDDVLSFISGQDNLEISADLLQNMAFASFIISDTANEIELLEKRLEITRNDKSRSTLSIVMSMDCNFNCKYCFEEKSPSPISESVIESLPAFLDNFLQGVEELHVIWFGGEPLLELEKIERISNIIKSACEKFSAGFTSEISTNGTLLTDSTCAKLSKCNVSKVQVGLDGPPHIHNSMRTYRGGRDSFWNIVNNIKVATKYLDVVIRVNLDKENIIHIEELFKILSEQELSGKVNVYPGQIFVIKDGRNTSSAHYQVPCYASTQEFAGIEQKFKKLAFQYNLAKAPSLPMPSGAPCTAVRAHDIAIGVNGELYKCLQGVGNPGMVVGHINKYPSLNADVNRWVGYNPTADAECMDCKALPICMGGCAQSATTKSQFATKCSTFRFTGAEQVINFIQNHTLRSQKPITSIDDLEHRISNC